MCPTPIAFLASPEEGGDRVASADLLATLQTGEFATLWAEPPRWSEQGDVLQGNLHDLQRAFDLHVALNHQAWPTPVQTVVVRGDSARTQAAWQRGLSTGLPFTLDLGHAPSPGSMEAGLQRLVEQAAVLHAAIMADWKTSRAKAAIAMRKVATQREAADLLGIRQQSISDALRAAHATRLLTFEGAVRDALLGLDPTAS